MFRSMDLFIHIALPSQFTSILPPYWSKRRNDLNQQLLLERVLGLPRQGTARGNINKDTAV